MNFVLYKGSFIWKQEFHLSSLFLEDNFTRCTTRHWRFYPWVWWSQLTMAHKDLLHTSLPNSAFCDVTRVVWIQPSWECLLHGAQKFCKSGLSPLLDIQVKPSPAQHRTLLIWLLKSCLSACPAFESALTTTTPSTQNLLLRSFLLIWCLAVLLPCVWLWISFQLSYLICLCFLHLFISSYVSSSYVLFMCIYPLALKNSQHLSNASFFFT